MLAHGEGGRLTRRLIRERILSAFGNDILESMDDAARLPAMNGQLAMTTDSFVVSPLFFPGGDIGSLAVYGTVNDLAVSGARPLYLTVSLILEEGLPIVVLDRVLHSLAAAARRTDIRIVAGDTKVVPRGVADGLFINTTGVGQLLETPPPGPTALQAEDELIVTGSIGRHGMAVLCAREELLLQSSLQSDCGPLWEPASLLMDRLGTRLRCMRDATRGGVAAVLQEWAESSQLTLEIEETRLPVSPEVRGACELLGLDPVHVANEGTMVVAVERDALGDALSVLHSHPQTCDAVRIGRGTERKLAAVVIQRGLGSPQPLDDPLGAPLPRIC